MGPVNGSVTWPVIRRWLVRGVLGGLLVALLVVGGTALRVWQYGRIDDREHADVILVLGAAEYNGRPSSILEARLDHAAALFKEGVASRIVTVGGRKPGDQYTEAEASDFYLTSNGVPGSQILVVNSGNDTLNSMRAAASVLQEHGWSTAVLVSDPWHMYRSETMARDSGIDAWTSPTHSGPAVQTRQTQFEYIARETAAMLYYRFTTAPADDIGTGLG
jgi:uncharacterized SAM-binding protein YcdF (DUF218 family)